MPAVSVIIPTNRSREVLERCLQSIAGQDCDPREIEVIVVFNGMTVVPQWDRGAWPFCLITDHIDEPHIGAAKNVALDRARGEWLVLLNDDVLADSDFLSAHVAAHRQLGQPAMVVGRSIWRRYDDETVFDRMIQTTSMIFFYDQMQPHAWYNFRHAWNLNLSLPRRCCESVRFETALRPVYFDDLEWAFRMEREHGLRVWYEPQALLLHDHRYTLDSYLTREGHLGRMAVLLWQCNPDCFRAIYETDLDEAYLDYCREFVRHEGRREEELLTQLSRISTRPAGELAPTPDRQDELVRLLYLTHLPLKRLAFRRGVLSAVEAAATPEAAQTNLCPA